MKIKAGDLRNKGIGLIEILKIELPVKPSYWLARIANKIDPEIIAFEKARMGLVRKYAKKDLKGNPIFLKDENGKPVNEYNIPNLEEFQKEYDELSAQEIDINIDPIKLGALGDIKIKPVILAKLGKIIEI